MSKSIGRVGAIFIDASGEGVVVEYGVGEYIIRDVTDARRIAQLLNGAADEVERMRAERSEFRRPTGITRADGGTAPFRCDGSCNGTEFGDCSHDLSGNPRFDRGG